jgi:lactoylglutathione lyase
MKLGYTIMYVPDVLKAVEFYEAAFGLKRRYVHDSGQYAEMETGATALGFAAEALAEANGVAIRPNTPRDISAGVEICLVTDTPEQAYEHAVAAGAIAIKPVEMKPWGQKVSYVRDLNGCLVEVCSPVPQP